MPTFPSHWKLTKSNLIIIIACLVYLALSINSVLRGGDLEVYLDAAEKLLNKQNIYKPPFAKDLQYYYSPLFAMALIPFTGNFFITGMVWLLVSGFLLYRSWVLIAGYLDTSSLSKKETGIWILFILIFTFRFIMPNISMIQVTIFLLWAILESIHLIREDKPILGALLLAFAVNIKLMPLVALPYLLYRGYFKAFGYVLVATAGFLLLPSLLVGHDFNMFLLNEWWAVINPGNKDYMIETENSFQSIGGILSVFLTETEGELPYKRNFLNLPKDVVITLINISRLVVVAFTLYFLKSPFKKSVDKIFDLRALVYILMLVPLIFPRQQKYAFLFIFPVVAYLSYYCLLMWKHERTKPFKTYLILLLVVSIVFTPIIGSDIIGRLTFDLVHFYRILGMCTLLLIPFLIKADPTKLHELQLKHAE